MTNVWRIIVCVSEININVICEDSNVIDTMFREEVTITEVMEEVHY